MPTPNRRFHNPTRTDTKGWRAATLYYAIAKMRRRGLSQSWRLLRNVYCCDNCFSLLVSVCFRGGCVDDQHHPCGGVDDIGQILRNRLPPVGHVAEPCFPRLPARDWASLVV